MKKPVALWILPADSFPFYRLSYWRTISQRSAPKHLKRPPQQFTPLDKPCASRRRCLKLNLRASLCHNPLALIVNMHFNDRPATDTVH